MKIEYQRRIRESASTSTRPATEILIPLILLAVGLGIYGIEAARLATARKPFGFFLGLIGFILAMQIVLALVSAFITAKVLSISFGELRTALLKLAGIIVLTGMLSLVIPYGGFFVLFVYLGLMIWLFGMEIYEAIAFAVIFAVIRFAVMFALAYGFTQ